MTFRSFASLLAVLTALLAAPSTMAEVDSHEHAQSPRAAALSDCCTPGDRDFPKVGGNLGNQNYSRLQQIREGNVRRLGAAWLNKIEGGLSSGNNQSTPVAVDGVIYLESAPGNVVAVDGRTGATKWKYTQTRGSLTRRGVAVRSRLSSTRSRTTTTSSRSTSATGALVWEVQHEGWGNVEKVALVYHGGKLFVGTNDGNRGAALALDATTGEKLWHFWGAPGPGEFGNDTWEGNSWRDGRRHAVDPPRSRSGSGHASTSLSATCAPVPRRTAPRAAATTCSPTRSSRWT